MPIAPSHLFAFLAAVFVWWFSTGAILWLIRQADPRASYIGAALMGGFGVWGLAASANGADGPAAYGAFLAALGLWGLHELAFLRGWITGPVRSPCPPAAGGWGRLRAATGAVLYHELALASTLGLMLWLTRDAPNQVGALTFAVLFVMRLSAKLNVFVGAPHLASEFLPERLTYLKSYFGRSRHNLLLPLCLAGAGLWAWRMGHAATIGASSAFEVVGASLVFSLLALAMLEHVFLAVPLGDAALWRWALRGAQTGPRRHFGRGSGKSAVSDGAVLAKARLGVDSGLD